MEHFLSKLKKGNFFLSVLVFYQGVAFAQQSSSPKSFLQAADSLYHSRQWKPAKERYSEYLKDSLHDPVAWQRLGNCNHELGMYPEAVSNYKKALSLLPRQRVQAATEARLARSYIRLKNEKEALYWLEKAAQSGYQDINEINRVKDFDAIKKKPAFRELQVIIYRNAYPCSADPKMKEFDFWLGEWDVYQNQTNLLVGHSLVQKVAGECALLESWNAVSGTSTGHSLNYYEAATNSWEQNWIGSTGGAQRYVNGVYKDSAMRFTYETISNGKKVTGNFIFYNLGSGKVRQYQDSSEDDGKTFSVSYDFIYIRRK